MSLKNKASKIDFGALMGASVAEGETKQPRTAPGAMMAYANDQRSEMLKENETLRARVEQAADLEARLNEAVEDLQSWDGAKATRLMDPATMARSRYANRHESNFSGPDFDRLKREIAEAGGNVQPIKVRPVTGRVDGIQFEIVFGHRRHEACSLLGLPVLTMVDSLDDRSLFLEMERENRERSDLSPWEQGVMYWKALDFGLFTSNRQLALALGIDHSNLGKSLALAKLPPEVVAAFATPLDIQLRWAPILNRALEKDGDAVLGRARELAADRGQRGPKGVLTYLTAPGALDLAVPENLGRSFHVGGKKAINLFYDGAGRATVKINVPVGVEHRNELTAFLDSFAKSL
ncbi:MAG: Chromosome partitioning protein ParB family [Variovorax sp.]|nr:Chromosome partitioning protein ParB family [Variovorax sp.]